MPRLSSSDWVKRRRTPSLPRTTIDVSVALTTVASRTSVTVTGLIVVFVVTVACALHSWLQLLRGHRLAVDLKTKVFRHDVYVCPSLVADDQVVAINRKHFEVAYINGRLGLCEQSPVVKSPKPNASKTPDSQVVLVFIFVLPPREIPSSSSVCRSRLRDHVLALPKHASSDVWCQLLDDRDMGTGWPLGIKC